MAACRQYRDTMNNRSTPDADNLFRYRCFTMGAAKAPVSMAPPYYCRANPERLGWHMFAVWRARICAGANSCKLFNDGCAFIVARRIWICQRSVVGFHRRRWLSGDAAFFAKVTAQPKRINAQFAFVPGLITPQIMAQTGRFRFKIARRTARTSPGGRSRRQAGAFRATIFLVSNPNSKPIAPGRKRLNSLYVGMPIHGFHFHHQTTAGTSRFIMEWCGPAAKVIFQESLPRGQSWSTIYILSFSTIHINRTLIGRILSFSGGTRLVSHIFHLGPEPWRVISLSLNVKLSWAAEEKILSWWWCASLAL